MGPRRIEIHINGQRTREPNSERGEESPPLWHARPCHSKRDPYGQKTIQSRGESHRDSVGPGKTVRGNMPAQGVIQEDADVRDNQEGSPKDRGPHGEMVFQTARWSIAGFIYLTVGVHVAHSKTGVRL